MAEPERAAPSPEVLVLLSELSRCLQRVAIISGRDTDFLVSRLPLKQLLLVGNHGMEERDSGASRVVADAKPYLARLRRAGDAAEELPQSRAPGVTIERKRASVSVHFRRAADPSGAGAALEPALQEIARREHLQLQAGRLIWELRPPIDIDKGEIMRRLATSTHPAAIVYAGDDRTDADAFSALKTMPSVTTVAVGVRSHEVPEEVFVDCDLLVDGVAGATQLLTDLLDFCRNG